MSPQYLLFIEVDLREKEKGTLIMYLFSPSLHKSCHLILITTHRKLRFRKAK